MLTQLSEQRKNGAQRCGVGGNGPNKPGSLQSTGYPFPHPRPSWGAGHFLHRAALQVPDGRSPVSAPQDQGLPGFSGLGGG